MGTITVFKNFLFLIILMVIGGTSFAEERTFIITTSDYKFRIHTSNHSIVGAQKTVLLFRKDENFSNSFFINLDKDKDTFSALIYLLANSSKIQVRFEDRVTSPWGDPRVFAITSLESIDGSLGN